MLLSAGVHGLLAPVEVSADGGMAGRLIFETSMPLTGQIIWPSWLQERAVFGSIFTFTGLLIYIWSSAISYRQMASVIASIRHLRALLPALPRKGAVDLQNAPASEIKLIKKKRKALATRKEPVIIYSVLAV